MPGRAAAKWPPPRVPGPAPPRLPFRYLFFVSPPPRAHSPVPALQQSVQSLSSLPLVALGSAMAVGCFNPVLSPLVPSPPGRRLRAALRSHPPTAVSLRLLACGAAAGRGTWRLAAAGESQAVQEQPARTEESGEAGGAGAPEASSKLVLVVGGTGGVGEIPISLLSVLALFSIFPIRSKISWRISAPRQ